MPRLSRDQIKQAALNALEESEGFDSDELSELNKQALDYYYNRPEAAPSLPGRSKVQSSDVADMVEAVVAQIMPALRMDDLAVFDPMGEQDVDQARVESEAVSWVVMQQSNGHYELQQAIRDALLMRNGIIKVYLHEQEDTQTEVYNGLSEMEYGQLVMGAVENLDGVDNGYTMTLLNEEDAEDTRSWDVRLVNKTTDRRVMAKAVDPSLFSWEQEYDSLDLQECGFCCERSEVKRSELLEMGYPKRLVNQVKHGGDNTSITRRARSQTEMRNTWQGATKADDICEHYEIYMRLDADGDGLSELLKICIGGDTLLEVSDFQYVPYSAGTAFLQPHRFLGVGLFDKLQQVQDSKTSIIRQWLDNQNHANNSRVTVVDGSVDMGDVTNSRPGGVIRADRPDAVVPFPFTDVGPSCQNALAYMDKTRSERGGASLDLQSAELQIAGETAHGVERQMSAKEQLAALMLDTLSNTLIRYTWQLVHKALRLYVPDTLEFRSAGQFQQANPQEWPERETITVKAGLSGAERSRKQMALQSVVARQDEMRQQGRYVSASDAWNAETDWLRVQGINDVDRYFTDPQSEEAQQYQQQQAQQAQQQEQYQQMLLELQRMIEERKADNADAKIISDESQFQAELKFKYWEAMISQETEEGKQVLDLLMQVIQTEGEGDAEEEGSGTDTEQRTLN